MIVVKDLVQGSEEWFVEKLGKPSASRCSEIITNEGKPSKQRDGYLRELAGEIITGKREIQWKNACTDQGNEREQESIDLFCMQNNCEVQKVGVIYPDDKKQFLCSPDALIIGKKEGLECKNVLAKTQVKYLLDGGLPSEYFGQIQFSLLVTGFKAWNWFSYCPGMKPLHVIVFRDEKFIKALSIKLEVFCANLKETVNKIK